MTIARMNLIPLILERDTHVALLGLRFWDPITQAPVGEGLRVTAYPIVDPNRRVSAVPNRSGVYVFHHLPGLRDFENGVGDDAFWQSLPAPTTYIVEVIDDTAQFLPFQFEARAPMRGLYELDCLPISSPLETPVQTIPLFSAPARARIGGMAVVRAELRDLASNLPAAWVLLEIALDGQTLGNGMADSLGRVAVILPYPEPPRFSVSSFPGGRRALVEQTWEIDLRAFYTTVSLMPELPDLCEVLNQTETEIFESLSPQVSLTQATLAFGQDLVLRTGNESVLYIVPAGSPP